MSKPLDALIKAHLNLYAVLQGLEDLVRLDEEMAAKTASWDIAIQFSVRNGPQAHVAFSNGVCTHGRGSRPSATVKLYFVSPRHLNAMFDGHAAPIPLKGFSKLGFLKNEFGPLTDRLAYYLRPESSQLEDETFRKINTTLALHTALFAAAELAVLEPVSRHLATQMGNGTLQVEVLPDGPWVCLDLQDGHVSARKDKAERPRARMTFRNMDVANDLLNDRVDAFRAVVQGDVMLKGFVPMLDNINLILDRVRLYLA